MINDWKVKMMRWMVKLTPEEILGLAKLLGVDLVEEKDEKPTPRNGEDIVLDIFTKVEQMDRGKRRNFLRLVHKAAKEKGGD